MPRLRIYTNPVSMETAVGGRVFYCQRDGGPPYMWREEKGPGQWHYTRVHLTDWKPRSLWHSRKDDLPVALRAKLNAHYL